MPHSLTQQTILICPLCETHLSHSSNSLICQNNHCFDFAKEGYVNLLPPQHKKSKEPGDNKEMIRCRRDFLNKDFYSFLIPAIISVISEFSKTNENKNFLDSGCGEGYFTDRVAKNLSTASLLSDIYYYGMDISKEAVRLAAKRNKTTQWLVASSNNIPVENKSLDIVLKINAPISFEKLKYKLSDESIVISVSPGKDHLNQLREILYLKPQNHKTETTPDGFTLLHQSEVEKDISITTQQDINNLFKMTPYYWNASETVRENVAKLNRLDTTASFNINVYQLNTKDTQ